MTFWIVIAVFAFLAALWMARPYLRGTSFELSGSDGAISIYRDQIDEIERDRQAGLISQTECDAARAEIERRALQAARSLDSGLAISKQSYGAAALVAVPVMVASVGLYMFLGNPGVPDQPLASREAETLTRQADAGDINARIRILVQKTQADPDNLGDWWNLGVAYGMIGDYALAADAYRRAAELGNDDPKVLSAYAEAMTLANGNKVPGAAKVIFQQLAADRADPRSRYYLALAMAQDQDFDGAIRGWAQLAAESPPGAPWMPLVRRDIVNMARFLKADVTAYLPDASAQEIADAGGEVENAGLGGDLLPPGNAAAALEVRLAEEPKDYKGWLELAQLRARGGDADAARQALDQARQHYAGAPFVLQKITEAERALGLDLVADGDTKGPTAEQMAAASELTQQERDDMIEGMVAGLAARLEEQPDDLDGWVMLVRSYSTLGKDEKAREAYETALAVFEGDVPALDTLRNSAGTLVGRAN